jgi:uncharacterized protein with PIN domain
VIVIDSSALTAMVLGAPEGDRCRTITNEGGELRVSAATVAETLIIANGRSVRTFRRLLAYALAKELGCPLLSVGNDFVRTDVMRA